VPFTTCETVVIDTPASVATSARRAEERRGATTVAWWPVTALLRNGLRKP
jgi:hypothetical protein